MTKILLGVAAAAVLAGAPSQTTRALMLAGTWAGSGTLTNNWTDAENPQYRLQCEYVGKLEPRSVTLSISATGEAGHLILDMPSPRPACPRLRKNYLVRADVRGTRATILDPAGHRWDLGLTDDLLTGTVTWTPRGPDPREALAVGFTYSPPLRPWDVPLTRLSGKVTLARVPGGGR